MLPQHAGCDDLPLSQEQLDAVDAEAVRNGASQLAAQLQRLNAQLDDALGAPSPLPALVRAAAVQFAALLQH